MTGDPKLFADERGVWREDDPGHPFGIDWDEIECVGGYKLDVITEVYTVIELDHPRRVLKKSIAVAMSAKGFYI